ncbi:MAG TPA: hypothetical protein VM266_05805 [Solirubrobacteraceae bacterium]|nr:hypothetical protein [Solirubrobacteraceae bacterium]
MRRRPLAAGAAVAAATLTGCTPWLEGRLAEWRDRALGRQPPAEVAGFEDPVPCGGGPFPSRGTGDGRHDLAIGSVIFRGLAFPHAPERFDPGMPALTVPVEVPPRSRVIIAIPPGRRPIAGLDGWPSPAATPREAHRAVRCLTGDLPGVFRVSFAIAGARCLPVAVTIDRVTTTRTVGFGVRHCRDETPDLSSSARTAP